MWAAMNDKTRAVQDLLGAGAGIDVQDGEGRSSLIWAVMNAKPRMVTQLVEAKATLDLQDSGGRTALMWAVMMDKEGMMTTLADAGANLNLKVSPVRLGRVAPAAATVTCGPSLALWRPVVVASAVGR